MTPEDQTQAAFAEGPWTPERADENPTTTKPKEDNFGDTIHSMSADSFRAAWDTAVNAGKINVNADDPRILTAYKQANQYITDMGTAGLLTIQGGIEAAAGAIGEVFGGDPVHEEMLANDILGMFESEGGYGPVSTVAKTDDLISTAAKVGEDIKLRANQPGHIGTVGSNLGNVGQAASSATETKLKRHLEGTPTPAKKSYLIPEEDISKMELLSDTPVKNLFEKGEGTHGVLESSNLGNVPLRDIKTLQEDLTYLRGDVQQLYLDKFKQDHNISFPNGVPSGFKSEDEAIRWFTDRVDLTPKANEFNNFLNRNRIIVNSDYRKELELPNSFSFRDPVMEFAQEVQIPKNGLKGSEFLKALDKTPHARSALYNTVDLGIDKAKTYTREELIKTIEPNTWVGKFEVQKRPAYRGVQTQELAGFEPEGDYSEIFYRIGRKDRDLPTFKIPDQYGEYHFPEDVAAHARISVNENYATKEKEIIVHELQSDYLQKGAKKPTKPTNIETFKKDTLNYALTALPEDMRSSEAVSAIQKVLDDEGTIRRGYVSSEAADTLNKTLRAQGVDFDSRNAVTYYIEEQLYGLDNGVGNTKLPLGNVKDSVENLLDGLLGQAQSSGIDKVYIPSLEQIVSAERLKPGTLSFFEAVRPGSFFYETYAKGLTESLDDLAKSTNTSVTKVDRPNVKVITYKDLPDDVAEGFLADMQVAKNYNDMTSGRISKEQFQKNTGLDDAGMSDFYSRYDAEFRKASKADNWLRAFKEAAYKDAVKVYGVDKQIDSVGTLIDIGESKNTYDFTKIKMAKGGLVRTFATGGLAEDEQMNRLMQEGGLADSGMSHEPTTGNEVPPGSLASEVRDDIPAQLSEGEYVVPADVLRYFGVRFFEDLRKQAKQDMMQMEADGRVGGAPVDSNGIPAGDNEELTPEEEQMLNEALSQGGNQQGFADGGVAFDRTKFSSANYNNPTMGYNNPTMGADGSINTTGIEMRKYINPQTKEVRSFSFINGSVMGAIPEGFVPWTQTLQDQANTVTEQKAIQTKTSTGTSDNRSGADRGQDNKSTSGTGDSFSGWAEKNSDAMTADPYGFGMNALSSVSQPAQTALGRFVGKTGVGHLAKDFNSLSAISDARAALANLDPNSQEAKTLSAEIDKAQNSINSPLADIVATVFAQGTQKNKASQKYQAAKTQTTPPTTATTPTTSKAVAGSTTAGAKTAGATSTTGLSTSAGVGAGEGRGLSYSGNTTGGKSVSTGVTGTSAGGGGSSLGFGSATGGKSASTSSGGYSMGSTSAPSSPSYGGGYSAGTPSKDYSSGNYGKAEGGLISRPTKKKTTRKTTKGLAGK